MQSIHITPYERRSRELVLKLLENSHRVHVHLDWYEPELWLERFGDDTLLLWHEGQLIGCMGASPALNRACWLRLAAVANDYPPLEVLRPLLYRLQADLVAQGVRQVFVLVIDEWISYHLPKLGFDYLEDVVTLRRTEDASLFPAPRTVSIRPALMNDLERIRVVDHAAFSIPWQLGLEDLRQAQRLSASCMVALVDDELVGYQLSTRRHHTGHLARLAVLPAMQGRGIGAALLNRLIRSFAQRGVTTITVNTQDSNKAAQALYRRYGFERSGFDLPIWKQMLPEQEAG